MLKFILHLSRISDWLRLEGVTGFQLVHLFLSLHAKTRDVAVEQRGITNMCSDCVSTEEGKKESLPNHEGTTISSHVQDMPAPHTGEQPVFPSCCHEVGASLCGLCSLWKLLWSSAGIC